MHNIYVVMIYVARGSVAWSESMICAHAIASPCNQATFECLCASRVASRPPIWSRLFYQEIYLYIYIYTSRLHASLPRRHRRKYETRREEIEIALNISWIQEEKRFSRETLPRLVQPCAFPPLEQIERDCLEKQKNRALLAFENRPRCFVVAVGWKLFSFLSTFFLFFLVEFESYCHEKKLLLKRKEIFTIRFYNLYCIVNICSRYVVRERNFCKIEVVQYEGMYVNFPLSIKFLISRIWNINKYQRRGDS